MTEKELIILYHAYEYDMCMSFDEFCGRYGGAEK